MRHIRISQIRAFIAIAENGSIRRAATKLGISQPALTKSIRQLETELQVPLLQRTSRGALLTEFGEAFKPRAKIIEAELLLIREEMAQLCGSPPSEITIGLSAGASVLLSKALEILWRQYPNAKVRVVEGAYESSLSELRQGRLAFSIVPKHLVSKGTDLKAEPIFKANIVPVSRRGHPLGAARSLRELVKQPWAISGSRVASFNVLESTFARYKLAAPIVSVQCESFPSLVALLTETNLMGILPEPLMHISGFQHILQIVPIEEKFAPTEACLLTRPDTPNTPLAAALIRAFRRAAR